MEDEIVNRVAKSPLVTFDLEDYYPKDEVVSFDVAQLLFEGIILREKEFRASLVAYEFSPYLGKHVALFCSTEAILPGWAYMLVASYLIPLAKSVCQGSIRQLLIRYYQQRLEGIDFSVFSDKPLIIKGCSHKPVPSEVYLMALEKLQPYARTIMYGEACSAVPIFKAKK